MIDLYECGPNLLSLFLKLVLQLQSPCFDKPCANGGSCVAKYEQDNYECVCTSGYTGRNCEQGKLKW